MRLMRLMRLTRYVVVFHGECDGELRCGGVSLLFCCCKERR